MAAPVIPTDTSSAAAEAALRALRMAKALSDTIAAIELFRGDHSHCILQFLDFHARRTGIEPVTPVGKTGVLARLKTTSSPAPDPIMGSEAICPGIPLDDLYGPPNTRFSYPDAGPAWSHPSSLLCMLGY